MFKEIVTTLRAGKPCAVGGIRTQADAQHMRDIIRLAEAVVEQPLSSLWTGTLVTTGEYTDLGKAVGKHGCKVFIEVAVAN